MNTPIKGNTDIRSNGEEFIDAYLKARDVLGRIDGVVGVGFGRKEITDTLTEHVSITVFVREKRPEDEIPPEQRIPPTFDGYRTDVRVVLEVVPAKCDNEERYDKIQGGIQLEARKIGSITGAGKGTLGCIVRKRGNDSGENYYLLTNDHALFDDNDRSGLESLVHHPSAPASGDTTSSQVIAMVEDYGVRGKSLPYTSIRNDGTIIPSMDGYVDCAIARLDLASRCCGIQCSKDNVQFDTTIIDLDPTDPTKNRVADVRDISLDFNMVLPGSADLTSATNTNRVVKVGRTTGRTVGIVTHVNSAFMQGSEVRGNVIEIELDPASTPTGLNCKGNPLFIDNGDSGSLVLDMSNRAVGLAFGSQPRDGRRRSFACHIVPVLDSLKICIPTTGGTGHGRCAATDGSGIARYGGSTEHLSDDGTVLFSGYIATGPSIAESRVQPPTTQATQEQHDRIERFFDTLRESEDGRRLHEAYTQVSREIGYLIRNQRRVTVTWHRHRGPAFLAGLLDHLQGNSATIPLDIGGISRATLLARMESVLLAYGSQELRGALERHRNILMGCADAATAQECIASLRHSEAKDVT